MYSSVEEVRKGIKDEALSLLIGDEYISDTDAREEKIEPIIAEAIADADGEIDGYLNKRYSVPLKNVPRVINKFSKDIALYNVFSRIGIDESDRDKTYLTRYEAAVKYLENVAKGHIDVQTGTDGEEAGSTLKSDYRVKSSTRLFNRNSMRGF